MTNLDSTASVRATATSKKTNVAFTINGVDYNSEGYPIFGPNHKSPYYDEFGDDPYAGTVDYDANKVPNPKKTSPDRVERIALGKVPKETLNVPQANIVIPPSDPKDYKWNLPPHKWSLPVLPSSDPNFMPEGPRRDVVSSTYRRGRIWWKYNDDTIKVQTKDASSGIALDNNLDTRRYGFQFVWNPETFSTQVAIQMDVTPDAKDRFLSGAGFFPATETISFNIRLDRTNDFAAAVGKLLRPSNYLAVAGSNPLPAGTTSYINPSDISAEMVNGYRPVDFLGNPSEAQIKEKLVDLYQRGTLADVEYLYRAINGPGPGGVDASGNALTWVNGRGISTADVGFLMPTLMNIDIGPLSYAGYVTNLTVNHISFTAEMIPMRTDVTISLNILATAGLSSSTASA